MDNNEKVKAYANGVQDIEKYKKTLFKQSTFGHHESEEAKQFLIGKGFYEKVVKESIFGGADFELVIAANAIINQKD